MATLTTPADTAFGLADLVAALSRPDAYPHGVDRVEVRQTHISVVFLAGDRAYKLKKPVNLGFVDYTTAEKRRHFCEEEVRLNGRVAAVYRGVVPVTRDGDRLVVGGWGEPVDYLVEMTRLPDAARLRERVARGEVSPYTIDGLAGWIADFHRRAAGGPAAARFGRFPVVAGTAEENIVQTAGLVGTAVDPSVHARVADLTRAELDRLRPLIEARAARGVPRELHGDLHLDHVYHFPDRPLPYSFVVVDGIEFNERFRFGDPVADAAFLVMDLMCEGRRDLADGFAEAYFRAAGDAEGRDLLPFYAAYRAVVRAKVAGMAGADPGLPGDERARRLDRARAHWLLALGLLEAPARRPCLVLVGGLPGSGKSTLARGLAAAAGFAVVRSDEVRKGLVGVDPHRAAGAPFGEGIYAPDWTERTYAECLARAGRLVAEGRRVVVDAGFAADRYREQFLAAARRAGVPGVFLHCRADPAAVWARLPRRRYDASDADWSIYTQATGVWQAPGPATLPAVRAVDTGGCADAAVCQALHHLRGFGLFPAAEASPAV